MEVPRLGNIKIFRQRIKWTQKQLAKEVGVGQSYIAKIEQEKQLPSYEILVRIFDILRTELLKLDNPPLVARDIATSLENMFYLSPDDIFKDAREKLGDFDQIPILSNQICVGSLTSKRVVWLMGQGTSDTAKIKEIMGSALPSFSDITSVDQMRDIMQFIPAAVLVRNGKVCGIITRSDIFSYKD